MAQLSSPDVEVRRQAVLTLYERHPERPEVVVALTDASDDPDAEVRRWACRTLGELGPVGQPAVPALEARLQDAETAVRRTAAFALQKLSPESTAYRAEILDGMRQGDGGLIVALGTLRPRPTWAVPALVERLGDRRPGLRRLAAETLGQLGDGSPEVRRALERLQRDADDRVRGAAVEALARLQSPPQSE